jgi:stage III sporulation protein AA
LRDTEKTGERILNTEDKNVQKLNASIARFKSLINFISYDIKCLLEKIDVKTLYMLEEIRLRAEKPMIMNSSYGEMFVGSKGEVVRSIKDAYKVRQYDILKTLELMSRFSIYAYQDEIKNGYLTLKGGHRVGITGKVVIENERVVNVKDISGMNIRISREVTGCADRVIRHIVNGKCDIFNTLIVSPPQCGKTTLLRDIARVLSNGVKEHDFNGIKTGIVDERSEIAACYRGVPQNDVGIRTDVLDGCPKKIGMEILLRAMSPAVIITDEIGSCGDMEAIMKVINAGVKIIASAHGYNISELKSRQEVLEMIRHNVFQKYIVLGKSKGPGTVEEIINGDDMKERIESVV